MKRINISAGAVALIATCAPLWVSAGTGLIGGRGTLVPPGLSEPSFSYDAGKRSPFDAPRPDAAPLGDNGGTVTEGSVVPADAVEAAVVIQAIFFIQGKPEALVNGQKVRPLDKLKIKVAGKSEDVNVLEINKAKNSVRLEHKGREFVRIMGGAKKGK